MMISERCLSPDILPTCPFINHWPSSMTSYRIGYGCYLEVQKYTRVNGSLSLGEICRIELDHVFSRDYVY